MALGASRLGSGARLVIAVLVMFLCVADWLVVSTIRNNSLHSVAKYGPSQAYGSAQIDHLMLALGLSVACLIIVSLTQTVSILPTRAFAWLLSTLLFVLSSAVGLVWFDAYFSLNPLLGEAFELAELIVAGLLAWLAFSNGRSQTVERVVNSASLGLFGLSANTSLVLLVVPRISIS